MRLAGVGTVGRLAGEGTGVGTGVGLTEAGCCRYGTGVRLAGVGTG
jgi:hypothetical protein